MTGEFRNTHKTDLGSFQTQARRRNSWNEWVDGGLPFRLFPVTLEQHRFELHGFHLQRVSPPSIYYSTMQSVLVESMHVEPQIVKTSYEM